MVTLHKQGRKGKGAIYTWAAGNGGEEDDNCGADGYVNSIYTIAVSAATHDGKIPIYGEPCSAIMVAALSSNGSRHYRRPNDSYIVNLF